MSVCFHCVFLVINKACGIKKAESPLGQTALHIYFVNKTKRDAKSRDRVRLV
ncbi:hypothetical protein L21SP5_00575 [Salinivirga cyanobacteriivorans]|uniref:Uncharacterized protein n=1 Tax=Salinivirga cyanobacteriivorans TaxID=1307839 RepID=A0A0S2HW23_9BACT|nr:hypothetical protein L21SP5_00575 [Salinivirga cyanobacteriivorans]